MQVGFECIVCGTTATATVDEEAVQDDETPLRTLRDCPHCDIETIWIETDS